MKGWSFRGAKTIVLGGCSIPYECISMPLSTSTVFPKMVVRFLGPGFVKILLLHGKAGCFVEVVIKKIAEYRCGRLKTWSGGDSSCSVRFWWLSVGLDLWSQTVRPVELKGSRRNFF